MTPEGHSRHLLLWLLLAKSYGLQIDIEFMVAQDRELEMILFENLYPLLQDDCGIEHPSLVTLVVDVVLTILCYLEVSWN